MRGAFLTGVIDPNLVETLIVLIPKGEPPTWLKEFHPISLYNVALKIVSKVLVNRLHPFLGVIIGHFQSSFIPGRSMMENAIIAQEVIHHM